LNYIDELRHFKISDGRLQEIYDRLGANEKIAEYFERLAKDAHSETLATRCEATGLRIKNCNSMWNMERFEKHKFLSLTSINLCHSKFCANCQKLMQATHLFKMHMPIDTALGKYDLYHAVFTLKNVSGPELAETLDYMTEAFAAVIKYLQGRHKIKNIDFAFLDFQAAVRSVEIKYSKKSCFHPHVHAIFVFRKDIAMPKIHRNDFSYSYDRITKKRVWVRDFSDFEILLQKLWYLLVNGYRERDARIRAEKRVLSELFPNRSVKALDPKDFINKPLFKAFVASPSAHTRSKKITKTIIDALPRGYSCICDNIDKSGIYETFKYIFKLVDEDDEFVSYETFKTLYRTTYKYRQFQTYGAWYNIKLDDDIDMTGFALYHVALEYLRGIEEPSEIFMSLNDVMDDANGGFSVVSKYKVMQYIDALPDPDKMYYLDHAEEFVTEYKKHLMLQRALRFLERYESGADGTRNGALPPPEVIKKAKRERDNNYWLDSLYDLRREREREKRAASVASASNVSFFDNDDLGY
jgi:hypothetical protein